MKYSKIEFAAATLFFLIFLLSAIYGNAWIFEELFPKVLMVCATYTGFLMLNYFVWPKYLNKKKYLEGVGLTLTTLAIVGLTFIVSYSYFRSWEYDQKSLYQANLSFFSHAFITAFSFLFIYALYVSIREGIMYQYRLSVGMQSLSTRIIREIVLAFSIWFVVLLPLIIIRNTGFMEMLGPLYFFDLPYCFIIYFLNLYWLIPSYKKDTSASLLVYFFKLAATVILVGVIEAAFLLQTYYFPFMGNIFFNWFLPTVITIGISWWVYLANAERYAQLSSLKTALGTSNANLQYLRSQINPHFLFNALNTLYGTALIEKAEKTGEGIQKLGDMMRFMLHENNQDKIALSRELDYLHNYIDLQNMRLALSPDLTIDMQIEDIVGYYEIAPMLLIPFIENAYKHGISLQEKSWINVNLFKKDNTLHLDVHNSIHQANENDPERFQSGTGLDNVRQRLELLYPNKHELMVRQNAREFFIHLSLKLTMQSTA